MDTVNTCNGVILLHPMKTAGSTVRDYLRYGLSDYLIKSMHETAEMMWEKDRATFERAYKVMFCRNPYDRLVSFFHFTREIPTNTFTKNAPTKGDKPFREWVHHYQDLILYDLKPQERYAYIDHRYIVDYQGRFETLSDNLDELYKKLKMPGMIKISHIHKSSHEPWQSYYDDDTRKLVSNLYSNDFELFKYAKNY